MFLQKVSFSKKIKLIRNYWPVIILFSFALWDLRLEIKLLIEHFTFTALFYAIHMNPFAFISLTLAFLIMKRNNK